MTVSDMNIASLLDVFDYALVLIYGLFLSVSIAGGCTEKRDKKLVALLCPVFLVLQSLFALTLGTDKTMTLGELAVKQIYPLIVHLPLVLILVLALKKPWGIAIVSTATAYLCCQPPRWGSMAVEALTHSAVAGNLVYIVLLSGSFYLFRRYFVAAAHGVMTSSPTALLLFGSLPCSYYIFDYATTIYSDALYSGIQALNEFLPTVLVVFYVLFLPAFHVQSQKRSSAEMQRSLLEVELLTGRHHQIRAQLSKIGCPIRGDLKYGARRSLPGGGISLHSRSVEFEHPVRHEPVAVPAPVPADDNLWAYFENL